MKTESKDTKKLKRLPAFTWLYLLIVIGITFSTNVFSHNKVVVIPLDGSNEPPCHLLGKNVECDESGVATIDVNLHFDCLGHGENGNNFGVVLQTFAVPVSFGRQIIQYLPEPQSTLNDDYFPQIVVVMSWGFGDIGNGDVDSLTIQARYLTDTSFGDQDVFELRHEGFRCGDTVNDTVGGPFSQLWIAEDGNQWSVTPVITRSSSRATISEVRFERVD